MEIIPIPITVICYSYVADLYEPEHRMFFKYLVLFTMGALHVQGLGHVLGIMSVGNVRMAVSSIVSLLIFLVLFSNVLIPVKELHYSFQLLSYLAPVKLIDESIFILLYGMDRCSDTEFAFILKLLDIEDKDLYINISLLVFQFFLFRAIALILFLLKVNPLFSTKKAGYKPGLLTK